MQHSAQPAPEFSRIVRADHVHRDERLVQTIEATETERQALADRFELEAIGALTATITLRSVRGGQMVRVEGSLEADVVQTCVVTLDPVPAHVSERFGALFAPESLVPEESLEVDIDPNLDDEDLPEPMVNNRIDIGELVAQHLSLALDPYPRAEGVDFAGHIEDDGGDHGEDHGGDDDLTGRDGGSGAAAEEPARPNPFAVLEGLKRRN